jgi:hypothetical protein
MDRDRELLLDEVQSLEITQPGLASLSDAVEGLSAESTEIRDLVLAVQKWKTIAEELSLQVRDTDRERQVMRLRVTGLFLLSAVLAVWALATTVLLWQ